MYDKLYAMGDLSIKNVPERQIKMLRARARANHRSLQGELRAILDEVISSPIQRRLTVQELVENARRIGLRTPSESVRMIREDRDR